MAEAQVELAGLLPAADLLGPVPAGDDERLLARVPRGRSSDLTRALKQLAATRSARKADPLRIEVDPRELA